MLLMNYSGGDKCINWKVCVYHCENIQISFFLCLWKYTINMDFKNILPVNFIVKRVKILRTHIHRELMLKEFVGILLINDFALSEYL